MDGDGDGYIYPLLKINEYFPEKKGCGKEKISDFLNIPKKSEQ